MSFYIKSRTTIIPIFIICILMFLQSCYTSNSVILTTSSPSLHLNIGADKASAQLPMIGWDTEGTGRDTINLLKSPVHLCLKQKNQVKNYQTSTQISGKNSIAYSYYLPDNRKIIWDISVKKDTLHMKITGNGDITSTIDAIEMVFHFNSRKAVTSIISSNWTNDGNFQLPVILSAPDIGQLLLTSTGNSPVTGFTEGSRREGWTRVILRLPVSTINNSCELVFTPVILPIPQQYTNIKRWEAARRGWFNLIQQSCGASGGGRAVAGVWANNVLSDPVSSLIFMLSDATILIPELAPGVTMPPILRRTIEYWIDNKTTDYGLVGYTAGGISVAENDPGDPDPFDTTFVREHKGFYRSKYENIMDGNPSVIIGVWAYVTTSSNLNWLKDRISDLEFIALYMENRDTDGDGLIESRQSGNSDTIGTFNPDTAWDTYLSGHKNAYVNTLAYRAFNAIADLEKLLGRNEQEERYRQRAIRIKAALLYTFYNPETGWLGWWRSRNGKLHDIYSDIPTSLAVSYGLISKDQGKEMLQKYWNELVSTGYTRFDLGVPCCLRPVPPDEYMRPRQNFHHYLNGGCLVSNAGIFLDGLFTAGMTQHADMILDAMLKRQKEGFFPNGGGFQNGFVDRGGLGAEFMDWEGNPTGYEGHLVYSWAFLQAMLRAELQK